MVEQMVRLSFHQGIGLQATKPQQTTDPYNEYLLREHNWPSDQKIERR